MAVMELPFSLTKLPTAPPILTPTASALELFVSLFSIAEAEIVPLFTILSTGFATSTPIAFSVVLFWSGCPTVPPSVV